MLGSEELQHLGAGRACDFFLYHAGQARLSPVRPDWVVLSALLEDRASDVVHALRTIDVPVVLRSRIESLLQSEPIQNARHPLVIVANILGYLAADPSGLGGSLQMALKSKLSKSVQAHPKLSMETALIARGCEVAMDRSASLARTMFDADSRPLITTDWTIAQLHAVVEATGSQVALARYRAQALRVIVEMYGVDPSLYGIGTPEAEDRWNTAREVEPPNLSQQNDARERFLNDGVVLSGLARPESDSPSDYHSAWLRYEFAVVAHYFHKGLETRGWYRLFDATSASVPVTQARACRDSVDWEATFAAFQSAFESRFIGQWWAEARSDLIELDGS